MPRINIEDRVWSDSRFKALVTSLGGNEEVAIGRLVRAWRIAQEWWSKNQQLIPEKIWRLNALGEELFDVMLAEKSVDGIYVSGATDHFAWLLAKKKAGRASGESRREKQRTQGEQTAKIPKNQSNTTVATIGYQKEIEHKSISVRTKHENAPYKNEPPSPSLPPSPSQKEERKKNKTLASAPPSPVDTKPTWDAFKAAYLKRWGNAPLQERQSNSQMKAFVQKVGQRDAPQIAVFYLEHNDGFYVKACHPVGLLLRDAQALYTQWTRGRAITNNDVRQFEKADATRSQLERIERGEL